MSFSAREEHRNGGLGEKPWVAVVFYGVWHKGSVTLKAMEKTLSVESVEIDLASWNRRAVYEFFARFAEPFHGICVRVDCTETYRYAKEHGLPVFLTLQHRSLMAIQEVENLRLRIAHGGVRLYETIHGGSAVGRENGTIGFGHYGFQRNLKAFVEDAAAVLAEVKERNDLERYPEQNIVRYSVLPWLDFTSLSHARDFEVKDSAPKITFGKMTETDGRRTMPVSIHAHHALADGLHVAEHVAWFEKYLANPEL
ncbi:MAG: CatA-like O-acetyltransferase [Acidobacteriaceae bacterium]|nr:CatA-like O-acetyltransferase [Acidobacteriaceae bacterium]